MGTDTRKPDLPSWRYSHWTFMMEELMINDWSSVAHRKNIPIYTTHNWQSAVGVLFASGIARDQESYINHLVILCSSLISYPVQYQVGVATPLRSIPKLTGLLMGILICWLSLADYSICDYISAPGCRRRSRAELNPVTHHTGWRQASIPNPHISPKACNPHCQKTLLVRHHSLQDMLIWNSSLVAQSTMHFICYFGIHLIDVGEKSPIVTYIDHLECWS